MLEELSRFKNICLGITSRISTVPPHCRRPFIPALPMEPACDIFYAIYDNGGRSNIVGDLVKKLDFHALSITLLATVAFHNVWDYDRLSKEWDEHRTRVLHTDYDESLAATIELSLDSPTFRKLGAHAHDLLGVVAFFPQGVDEKNLDWLFPTIPDRNHIFDKFCALSLTSRSGGFITMLAPIRDHLHPRDPKSSPLLCTTRDCYFNRLSVCPAPHEPGSKEARWIASEDVNVEHLLDVFTSIDRNLDIVWDACADFITHLYWHRCRYTVLGPKIEGLPDHHRSKPGYLIKLSCLSQGVGNFAERKRLVDHALKLQSERGNQWEVAHALRILSDANWILDLYEEGIQQAKGALRIYEQLGDEVNQGICWGSLARLLHKDEQLDAAEEAALRSVDLLPETGQEFQLSRTHRFLGNIYASKRKGEEAIHHLETALGIASAFGWSGQLFWINDSLAQLSITEQRFDEAAAYIEQAKAHAVDSSYELGHAMHTLAALLYQQSQFGDAITEVSGAIAIFEKLGASKHLEESRDLLRIIEEKGEGVW